MTNIISQETFNDVVKENIELFEMSLDEAIIEAKQQFEAQNVNLYNIITDKAMFKIENDEIRISIHPVIEKLNEIKNLTSEFNKNVEKIDPILESLKIFFQSDLAYRLMGANNSGLIIMNNVLKIAILANSKSLIKECLITLCSFLTGQPDVASEDFLKYLVDVIQRESEIFHIALIYRIFFQCCVKHEGNKQILINEPNNIIPIAVNQLDAFGLESKELTKEVCSFLRNLILDDDIRVPFGKGSENAKTIVTETNCLEILLKLCVEYKEREDEIVVAELFYTLDKLSIRNEFCQRILDLGGVNYILEALENHIDSQRIVTSSFAVLKSLAANDKVKVEIGKKNGLELILKALEMHVRYQSSCVNGFGALAAVTLRTEDNCRVLVKLGLPQLLKQAIQIHTEQKHYDVLRPICLTTRNVVSRCPELIADILEAGMEERLNVVLKLGRDCDDEAKAALRDLGCKVELKELWTGKNGVKLQ